MQVLSLILFPVYGFNEVYRRSFKSHVTAEGLSALDNATRGGTNLSPTAIAEVAPMLVAPSAEVDALAPIYNGWRMERYRFVLRILENGTLGTNNIVYYIGHTDRQYDAVSHTGNIAGDLQFFINASHRIRTQQINVSNTPDQTRYIPMGADQIIYGSSNLSTLEQTGVVNEFKMRPSEVFHAQNSMEIMQRYGILPSSYYDETGTLVTGGAVNSRRNNTPGSYLFDTLKAYEGGLRSVTENGYDESLLLSEALHLTRDKDAASDPFFFNMSRFNQQINERGQFSWDDLVKFAPYIDSVTQVYDNQEIMMRKMQSGTYDNNMLNNVWHAGNTDTWNGADNETISAALLCNAIPTIMLESLVADLRISFTNLTTDGTDAFQIHAFNMIAEGVDGASLLNRVIDRIKRELIPQVSLQGNFGYTLLVDSSVIGETMVSISINGGPERIFVLPTFADNMASPVITTSREHYENFTSDMYSIGCQLFDKVARSNMSLNDEYMIQSSRVPSVGGHMPPSDFVSFTTSGNFNTQTTPAPTTTIVDAAGNSLGSVPSPRR